jgi:hypothetical protein
MHEYRQVSDLIVNLRIELKQLHRINTVVLHRFYNREVSVMLFHPI